MKRWIAHPQRFVPYISAMPQYFGRSQTAPVVPWMPNHPVEIVPMFQVEAARDTVMNLPTISEWPLTRNWMQLGGGAASKK